MITVGKIADWLESFAPPHLAEEWDNVGLLVGDRGLPCSRAMTCLTLTPDSVTEAIEQNAQLVVTHHPLPFRPLKRITTDTVEGRMLWELIGAGVAIYSPHTAFDSAAGGVNARLAERIGLLHALPLTPDEDDVTVGTGRVTLPSADAAQLGSLAEQAKAALGLSTLRIVGVAEQPVTRVAIACGSGASLLDDAIEAGCDAMITGEASFHACLAAQAANVGLVLLGHYASERFALELLAEELHSEFRETTVWASRLEHDPIRTM